MGEEIRGNLLIRGNNLAPFLYDKSWNELMPVIMKISSDLDCHLVMAPGYAYFHCENSDIDLPEGFDTDSSDYYGYGDIQSIFQIVVDFLTFYNSINTSKNLV